MFVIIAAHHQKFKLLNVNKKAKPCYSKVGVYRWYTYDHSKGYFCDAKVLGFREKALNESKLLLKQCMCTPAAVLSGREYTKGQCMHVCTLVSVRVCVCLTRVCISEAW